MKRSFLWWAGAVLVLAGVILMGGRHPASRKQAILPNLPASNTASAPAPSGGALANTPPAATGTNAPLAREFDPSVNPYAGALREPGKSKRSWPVNFLDQYQKAATGDPIRFELTGGIMALGTIKITQSRDSEVTYISGELTQPEPGKFFFLKPPPGGKAGKAVGVVEFPGSRTAYRVEPTGPNGDPELWQRRLDEVLCLAMPLMDETMAAETANIPPLRPDTVPDYIPTYNSNIVSLQSYPGSPAVLLLDFFGGYTPTWGGVTYPRPNVSNAQIKDLWKRVAEDFMPFNINVTTDLRVYQNAPASSRQRCVLTPSTSALGPGAAGVAYIGSWNWGSDTVCWSIYTSGKAGGEVASHEPGHTLGLGHQGTSTDGYYGGQGSGATGWAPIMGAGYYQPVVTWAKGEYQDANNHEDELNIITTQNNNVAYRTDDTGSTFGTSRYLEVYPDNTAFAEGVIERTGDADAFQFTTGGGQIALTAFPVGDWANLAVSVSIRDTNNTVLLSSNPQTTLSAGITNTLSAGTYTFVVTGAGRNNALNNGFSSYASLGYYSITGTVAAARQPTRLRVVEHAPNGTLVGVVPASTTTNALAYAIVSGNTGNTFSIDNRGVVRVAYNTLLDYNRLATNSMLPVQFELIVNISNLDNPALTELKRRVVIAVLNANDPPVVTGFSSSVLEHTQVGTVLGAVKVQDPDYAEILTYSLAGGDPNGMFAVDQFGTISVAGDLSAAMQKTYTLAVAVRDDFLGNGLSGTGYVTINVITNLTPFQPGSISYALYDNIGSSQLISGLTGNTRWPRDPSSEQQVTSFEGLVNRADSYGTAMRGYLIPPQTGYYTFWIATDDNGELWLNASGTNPATISRIAYITGADYWASSRQWNKYASQQSSSIYLVAGQGYYLEARMKEGSGGDNIAVAWKGPPTGTQTNVIPGSYLAPFLMNYLPHAAGFTTTVRQGAFAGTPVGAIAVTDVNPSDAHSFAITAGNSAGLFSIDADTGIVRVADEAGLLAAVPTTYTLQVQVADSGSPPLSTTASATITVLDANAITATQVRREIWNNIGSGTAVSDLTNNTAFPRRPNTLESLTSFASALNIGDNYGSRIRAYLTPANSGVYRFFISSDDNSTLWFSLDGNPLHATRIAMVTGWTAPNTWTGSSAQMSGLINLVADQRYYLEALQKEGGGDDHVEVAWAGPGIVDGNGVTATNIIDGSFLSPFDINYAPQMNNQVLRVFASAPNGTAIGRVSAADSPLDALTFKLVDGNTNNMFALSPAGVLSILDNTLIADGSITSFPLTVAVQDSGYGGLYPARSAQATVTVVVQAPGSSFAWTGAGDSNNWANAANWGGAVPSDGARLIFGAPWLQSNFNDALASVASVQFTNGGFNLSGAPLTLQSGLTNSSGNNTWDIDTTLAAAQTWQNASGVLTVGGNVTNGGFTLSVVANGDFRMSGPLSGSGGLTKSGTARLLMSGTHAYSGTTIIQSAGASTSALEVNGGNDLDIGGSDLILYGRMDLGTHNAIVGALNGSSAGTIFPTDLAGDLTVGANNHTGTFSGVLQNSASGSGAILNLVKTGTGSQTLNGANTFSGQTVVAGGALVAASPAALGATSGGTIVYPGATLALSGGLAFNAEPLTLSGDGYGGSGALRNDSGLNTFNGPITLAGPATIRATAGSLTLGGTWDMGGNSITLDAAAASLVISRGIGGAGSLAKTGPGGVKLNAACTFLGSTTINQGTLLLGLSGSLASGNIWLAAGTTLDVTAVGGGWTLGSWQTLQGYGTVNGTAVINGTLLPGGSIGTLTFNGNVSLGGNTIMEISKAGSVLTNDVLVCSSSLALGGTLTVVNVGPDALAAGDAFSLFQSGTSTGAFTTLSLPALPTGLSWDTSTLGTDGTLRVILSEPATPPSLSVSLGGGNLVLSWPTSYVSFILFGQTNPPGQGLGTNWSPVTGVINNSLLLPLDTNNGSVFFRLTKP